MHYIDSALEARAWLAQKALVAFLFYADWCPFSLMARINFELAEENYPNITFCKVPLDSISHKEIGRLPVKIQGIPTFLLSHSSRPLLHFSGYFSLAAISELLDQSQVALEDLMSADTKRPIEQDAPKFILSVTLPPDITEYRSRASLKVYNSTKRETLASLHLDRTQTHLLLFLDYARRRDLQTNLFSGGRLTDQGRSLLSDLKHELNVGAITFHALETVFRDKMYIPKQISRLNSLFRLNIGEGLVIRTSSGYRLNESIQVEIQGP